MYEGDLAGVCFPATPTVTGPVAKFRSTAPMCNYIKLRYQIADDSYFVTECGFLFVCVAFSALSTHFQLKL
jgi:hypothetical protein